METAFEINCALVKRLIQQQFPQYQDLKIHSVKNSGHDNRTFHLGKYLTVRLPSSQDYIQQVKKESQWLPYLQNFLDYQIPQPVAMGQPSIDFPYPWSINKWIEGDTLFEDISIDKKELAIDLALALKKLQAIDCSAGPKGGQHNFFRGCDLKIYHQSTLEALEQLKKSLPVEQLLEIWQDCISTVYQEEDVWVHGDVAPGNILTQNHIFYGLIDFGVLGTGDPACDYAMAWTYFDDNSRAFFLRDLDVGLVQRARGWALWKALITYNDTSLISRESARYTINIILNEK